MCVLQIVLAIFINTVIGGLELGHAGVEHVHRRSGPLPGGRVLVTSATIPAQHGALDADQRAGQNLPLSPPADHQLSAAGRRWPMQPRSKLCDNKLKISIN